MNGILSILSAPVVAPAIAPAPAIALRKTVCEIQAIAELLKESDDYVKSNTGLLLADLTDRLFDGLEVLDATT